jgi:isopenicillin N synthase-like dioxygenase
MIADFEMSVPVVNINGLRNGTDADRRRIAAEIGEAARETGFLCVADHGIPLPLLAETFAQARAFFALPVEEKMRVSSRGGYRGYMGRDDITTGDLHESFDVGVELSEEAAAAWADRPLVRENRWPDLPGFRETVQACFAASHVVFEEMHRAIAIDLGADPEFFTPLFGRNYGMRMTHYPAVPEPGTAFGSSPHTDFGNLTLLAEDASGLELRGRDGVWRRIEAAPSALVCNIGDCLMRWSNDTYRSTLHRVVNPPDRSRISIGFFANADFETTVDCLPSCTSEGRPPKYPPVEFGDYMQARFSRGYVKPEATNPA